MCGCLLLSWARFQPELRRLHDAVALVFLGAMASMLLSATIGSTTLIGLGALRAGQFWPTWSVWWSGDAMGVLTVTPLLLAIRHTPWPPRARPLRWLEAAGLLTAAAVTSVLAAWVPAEYHLSFLVFPVLVWAATRFHLAGTAPCVLLTAGTAILAAAHDAGLGLVAKMVDLQAFNGSVALTGLLLAALTSQRDRARREVEQACTELADTLAALRPGTPLLDRLVPRLPRPPRPDTEENGE